MYGSRYLYRLFFLILSISLFEPGALLSQTEEGQIQMDFTISMTASAWRKKCG
jgi:hypothetical protein